MPKWSVLNVGIVQEAVLLRFLFSLHIDSLSSCHSRVLKYADDFVIVKSYSKGFDQDWLNVDLSRLAT